MYSSTELVEVAVRALSPGINDPHTAMSVLDRLGVALCDLCGTHLPSGVTLREGAVALVVPSLTYRSLAGVMFHMIRQNAAGSTAVVIRMLDVLTAVIGCETDPARREVLARHSDLVWSNARRHIGNENDLADVGRRHATLQRTLASGVLGAIGVLGR